MHYLLTEKENKQEALDTLMLKNPKAFSILSNDLTQKIINEIAIFPSCPMDVARRLKVHEQKVYYHIRKLEKLGLIKIDRMEDRVGATAKIYKIVAPVIAYKLYKSDPIKDIETKITETKFLKPFVENGKFNALIVVGSPDPHGKYKSPASDGYCAINLGVFLGHFINNIPTPFYKLDTQTRDDDLKNNLILIGGPKTNIFTERINKSLPIYFDYSEEFLDWSIVSTFTKNVYRDKHVGFILRAPNPFCEGKEILLFAGKGFRGTRAAVLGFTQKMRTAIRGNSANPEVFARVVKGIDVDSDGIIDDIEFLE